MNVYKNIRNIQEEGFELWNNIGMCFYRKNKLIAVIFHIHSTTVGAIDFNLFSLFHHLFSQAISCLKKALWLCPLNFNVLYNLGVVLMTAQQFASAFQCFVSAVSVRTESAESFMMLASQLEVFNNHIFRFVSDFVPFSFNQVCLYYLNDSENAQISFRKSILSSNAIKNPLIYLNYSIFALECLKDFDETQQYLNNFYNLCETIKVPDEVSNAASLLDISQRNKSQSFAVHSNC